MARKLKSKDERIQGVNVCLPGRFERFMRTTAKDLGLSVHEFVEAFLTFLEANSTSVEIAETLRPYVRYRDSNKRGLLRD